jgi:hypothetical protein
MLEAIPKSWFSWNFKINEGSKKVADLDISSWREKGELRINGVDYVVFRKGTFRPTIILEQSNTKLAKATRSSIFRHSFLIETDGKQYTLEKRSFVGRKIILKNDLGEIGSVSPKGFLSRRAIVDLPENMELPLRIFVIWLALFLWKRESGSSAGSSG